jgi:AraC-like DNA-binding protein
MAYDRVMAILSQTVASGRGWRVIDVLCDHGPKDRAFAEQHTETSIAAVTHGSFQYRSTTGRAMLTPGSLLLGNAGACFECGHEHAAGDRCLAFHFAPAYFESVAAGVPGARSAGFSRPSLPPTERLVPLLAEAALARDEHDAFALEEIAVRLAGAAVGLLAERATTRRPTLRDERRITRTVRHIERHADEPLTLSRLAQEAAMSPYHFLRTFRDVTGLTPHRFILRARMYRAALRLRQSDDAVSAIAYECGFNDLATFNRRFARVMGATPTAYRVRRQGARENFSNRKSRNTAHRGSR